MSDSPQDPRLAEIRALLWADQPLAARTALEGLRATEPALPGLDGLDQEIVDWLAHTASPEAYTAFYQGHRRIHLPADAIPRRHEQIPRLGRIRTWMAAKPPTRILDLGCFDGFALLNLCHGFGATGMGVDVDREALAHAAKSAETLGVQAAFVESLLEDFGIGEVFDAVLLMEVLEHVLDPRAALAAAERHLAPGGRIFLTTPATPVPHEGNANEAREHLRCLPEAELLALLGERAVDGHEVLDAGSHRERVLCYRRPRTAFVVNPVGTGWTPDDPRTYRGSEEGVIELARTLAGAGHEVEVFHNAHAGAPAPAGPVRYLPHQAFRPEEPRDIVVVVKWPQALDRPIAARRVLFWTADPNGPEDLTALRLQRIHRIVAISPWHREELLKLNPGLGEDRVAAVPFGVPDGILAAARDLWRPPHRMVYASSPDRGLAFLLDHWAEIREAVPDAELHVWHDWWLFDQVTGASPEAARWKGDLLQQLAQPGITLRSGSLPDDPTPYLEAALWAYPCTGGERFCLVAVKAQRLGAVPVVVPTMALRDTVRHGVVAVDHAHYAQTLVATLLDEEGQRAHRARMLADPEAALSWAEVHRRHWQPEWLPALHAATPVLPVAKPSQKRQTLAACFIAFNSEALFIRALQSVRELSDEIIVVDQGSTDRTLELARAFGAKVLEDRPPHWCLPCGKTMPSEHFAETDHEPYGFEGPRNTSIQAAGADWILWLDTDEELLRPHNLAKYLRRNCYNGYGVRQHHFSAVPPNAFKPDLPVRVFRNGQGIRFFGKIHEHPETAINHSVTPCLLLSDLDIAHDGYLVEEVRRKKFARNIGLMIADRRAHPERTLGKFLWLRDLIHLSRYKLEASGGRLTPEVVAHCEEAVALFEKEFIGDLTLYARDGLDYYSEALRVLNRGFEAAWAAGAGPGGAANTGEVMRARFSSVENWQKVLQSQTRALVDPFTGRYV